MKDLVIFGAGGMAKETAALVHDINREKSTYRHVAYAVDNAYYRKGMKIREVAVVSREWVIEHRDDVVCVCAIGYPKERREVQQSLIKERVRFASLIHPSSRIGEGTTIGTGCIVEQGCDITVDCHLGNGVFVNGNVSIGHDSTLEDFVTCFSKSHISGRVWIGEAACIGTMVFIGEKRKIGAESVVAPGSIVFNNVMKGTHVMGNPAKRIEI